VDEISVSHHKFITIMKTNYTLLMGMISLVSAAKGNPETTKNYVTPATGPAPITLESLGWVSADSSDFLRNTRLFYAGRLRGEIAHLDGFDNASLISLSSHFGFETGAISGFRFLAEGENTLLPFNRNDYSPFPGGASGSESFIGDPDNMQLNRLQLSWSNDMIKVIVGRQALKFDDERFIGTIGWRQNDETCDALSLQLKPSKEITLDYVYIAQVNRIFGNQAPLDSLEEWDSDSHLLRATYDAGAAGKITGFAYLLDFYNSPKTSLNTVGMEWQGNSPAAQGKATWLATAAVQTDSGNNPIDQQTEYFRLVGGYEQSGWTYQLGGEYLGSDHGNAAFQFPLATNHRFQGYADAFVTTPKNGIWDFWASVGMTCDCGIAHSLALHHFDTIENREGLGWEIDYTATKALNEHTKILAKLASLEGENSQKDTLRISLECDVVF
jgi:Alginate export